MAGGQKYNWEVPNMRCSSNLNFNLLIMTFRCFWTIFFWGDNQISFIERDLGRGTLCPVKWSRFQWTLVTTPLSAWGLTRRDARWPHDGVQTDHDRTVTDDDMQLTRSGSGKAQAFRGELSKLSKPTQVEKMDDRDQGATKLLFLRSYQYVYVWSS